MRTFITSDTHFGHANIIQYCDRPFASADEMDAELIRRWNATIQNDDIVWHLGDFCLCRGRKHINRVAKYFAQLNGRINIVLGNHDSLTQREYLELGFNKVYDKPVVINDRFILSHEPIGLPLPNIDAFFVNIYGHVHNNNAYSTFTRNRACVCVERWDYTPIMLDTIMSKFK